MQGRALFFVLLVISGVLAAGILERHSLPAWLGTALMVGAWPFFAWTIVLGCEMFLWRPLYGMGEQGVPRQRRLVTDLFNAALWAAAAGMIAYQLFGQSMTGLLATSGVVAIIVGFALQQVLADVFAGIALNIERPFKAGDWITLDKETHGLVLLTGWRATHLRNRALDLVVIPNAIVARARLVNHSRPSSTHLDFVEFRLGFAADPEAARAAVLSALGRIAGLLKQPAPIILQHELEPFWVLWRAYFFVDEFAPLIITKGAVAQAIQGALRSPELAPHLPKTPVLLEGTR